MALRRQVLRTARLQTVRDDYSWPELSAYAVCPVTRHLTRRVRMLIDYLVEALKGEPYWERG